MEGDFTNQQNSLYGRNSASSTYGYSGIDCMTADVRAAICHRSMQSSACQKLSATKPCLPSRWGEFLTTEPREANTQGGVLPAIFGTVAMTVLMVVVVVPFGVITALCLREYAKQGKLVSIGGSRSTTLLVCRLLFTAFLIWVSLPKRWARRLTNYSILNDCHRRPSGRATRFCRII
ncbi:MAG: hypothetical protein II336_19725 [Loktanella sp.]|nr:hypothetical protein [Loktanella sp.]